jgi:deazaflavin-dependent oxidoreductase (nitroreductase family)
MAEPNAWSGSTDTNTWNATIVAEFRANGGQVGGAFEGRPLLVLHTLGARSGQTRVTPLMYLADQGRYVVIASYGGNARHPAWYFNLLATPEASIEIAAPGRRIETLTVVAQEILGPERDMLYDQQAGRYPGFAEYERVAGRTIPVVALTPQNVFSR